MMRRSVSGAYLLVGAAAVMTAGCNVSPPLRAGSPNRGNSSSSASVGGRTISTHNDYAGISSETHGGDIIVRFGRHTVRVEKESLRIDDRERAKIPAAAKKIELAV